MIEVVDTIEAKPRTPQKKGGARKLRSAGSVPAVAYGPSSEPQYLSLDAKDFLMQRQKFGRSHLYTVAVEGGESFKAIVKEVQRHPVSRRLTHVDLLAVDMNKTMRVNVPVELVGKPRGAIDGGVLTQILRSVELSGLPATIPSKIVFDVSPLGVGESVHLHDLKLPEGVKVTALHDEAVAIVSEPDSKGAPAEGAAAAAAPAPAAKS